MLKKPLVLSADVGTSSLKAALIDSDGSLAAFARVAYPAYPERADAAPLFSTAVWENAFATALSALSAEYAARTGLNAADRLEAVCVSANGPTLVPYTIDGKSLPPLLWRDGRVAEPASGESAETKSLFLPHAAWFAQNEPALYEKTTRFISAQEWVSFMLGAEPATSLPNGLYEEYYWNKSQCALFGLDMEKFPPFVEMGGVIGGISEKAAQRFNLKPHTPIIAGAPDFIAALIGTGVVEPGLVCDRAGTSEGINLCAAFPETDRAPAFGGLRTLPHIHKGRWNLGCIIPQSGSLFDQYRMESGRRHCGYDELLRTIIREKGKGYATLATMALQVKNALDTFQKNGFAIAEMRVSGGQAKNKLWNQLKADLTGCVLIVPEIADGELAGDSCLAAVALGWAKNVDEAAARLFHVKERYEPRLIPCK
ncbi:MAG: FGGY-family carbohydrate kinase [Treponema sp.]|jgi:xylulokinase|nr:FGGY-family carbohydrate kinase [Treponema sp.]